MNEVDYLFTFIWFHHDTQVSLSIHLYNQWFVEMNMAKETGLLYGWHGVKEPTSSKILPHLESDTLPSMPIATISAVFSTSIKRKSSVKKLINIIAKIIKKNLALLYTQILLFIKFYSFYNYAEKQY